MYSLLGQTNFSRTFSSKISSNCFPVMFVPIPGTDFPEPQAPTDNSLHKKVKSFLKLDAKKYTFLKKGTHIKVTIPLDPGECPEYVGHDPRDINALKFHHEHEEEKLFEVRPITEGQSAEEKRTMWEETKAARLREQRVVWNGEILASSQEYPEGYMEVMLRRPVHSEWLGPKEEAPRVTAMIPFAPVAGPEDPTSFCQDPRTTSGERQVDRSQD
jgi:hypothetical protein